MTISRKQNKSYHPLQLGDAKLEQVHSYKYLGVMISSNLSWADHIHSTCLKAKRLVGMLYRKFYINTDSEVLFKLYLALVRPHLEYACEIWSPYLQKEKEELERVQKLALRMCVKQWDAGYADLLSRFSILTLADRRKLLRLSIMYKIIHGLVHSEQNFFVPKPSVSRLRCSNTLQVIQPFANTNFFFHSFVPLSSSQWNKLPSTITNSSSLSHFKNLLTMYMY